MSKNQWPDHYNTQVIRTTNYSLLNLDSVEHQQNHGEITKYYWCEYFKHSCGHVFFITQSFPKMCDLLQSHYNKVRKIQNMQYDKFLF